MYVGDWRIASSAARHSSPGFSFSNEIATEAGVGQCRSTRPSVVPRLATRRRPDDPESDRRLNAFLAAGPHLGQIHLIARPHADPSVWGAEVHAHAVHTSV